MPNFLFPILYVSFWKFLNLLPLTLNGKENCTKIVNHNKDTSLNQIQNNCVFYEAPLHKFPFFSEIWIFLRSMLTVMLFLKEITIQGFCIYFSQKRLFSSLWHINVEFLVFCITTIYHEMPLTSKFTICKVDVCNTCVCPFNESWVCYA